MDKLPGRYSGLYGLFECIPIVFLVINCILFKGRKSFQSPSAFCLLFCIKIVLGPFDRSLNKKPSMRNANDVTL